MKKLATLALSILVLAGMSFAQTYTSGTGMTGYDILGAHQNSGRGCAGCHAPHSGALGNGGNATSDPTKDQLSGTNTLWGQDVAPLYGQTLTFAGNAALTLPASQNTPGEVTQIALCLSCHDGNMAKGAMMTNQLYEQRVQALPSGTYGPHAIPTLLGADGTSSSYLNDHPVGPSATMAGLTLRGNPDVLAQAFTVTSGAWGPSLSYTPGGNAQYDQFVKNYGYPNIINPPGFASVVLPSGATSIDQAYITCGTCHTPHKMYVYKSMSGSPIMGQSGNTYPTYFFIWAPYNPGADISSGKVASSATQFCRQCHFTDMANESYGIMNVPTAF